MGEEKQLRITGQEFQTLRQAMGLTSEALAHLLGCAWGTVRNIEAQPAKTVHPSLTLLMTLLLEEEIRQHLPRYIAQREALLLEKGLKKKPENL